MARRIVLLTFLMVTVGACGTRITVPLDSAPLSADKATLVIYHEQGFTDEFQVYMDNNLLGQVTSEKPLKVAIEPGKHELFVKVPVAIDRITTKEFAKGETYYMKIWLDMGFWVSSIRIDPTSEVPSYSVKSYRQ